MEKRSEVKLNIGEKVVNVERFFRFQPSYDFLTSLMKNSSIVCSRLPTITTDSFFLCGENS